jgi:hypothetical protein
MNAKQSPHKRVRYEKGRLYFTKDAERTLFLILTIGLLIYGALAKIGWL